MSSCNQDTLCRWLEPGCTDPKLAAAGCYDQKDLDCGAVKPCTGGRVCTTRNVHPCPGGKCAACAQPLMICL
jgi:hypothetical protein